MNAPAISWCRHCGLPGQLTREHIPPRSSNNDTALGRIVNPFDLATVVQQVSEWHNGHAITTLDADCNRRASDWGYVKEYRRWYDLVVERAKEYVRRTNADPLRGVQAFELDLPYDVQPARFARQLVGMFLAVQATEHLFAGHPVLPQLVGPEPSDSKRRLQGGLDITPLHLYVSAYNGNYGYVDRPMLAVEMRLGTTSGALWTPPSSSTSQTDETFLLLLPPFAVVLTTKKATDLGCDISDWSTWSVDQRPKGPQRHLVLPTADQLQGGLRAMAYPTDYVVH